jgi:hypothetical protein
MIGGENSPFFPLFGVSATSCVWSSFALKLLRRRTEKYHCQRSEKAAEKNKSSLIERKVNHDREDKIAKNKRSNPLW